MLDSNLVHEIKNRDFFKNVNHYRDFDHIKTNLIIGNKDFPETFLTIIIPVYDHPIKFIARAINSALNQDNPGIDYKILVIDDYAFPDKDNGVENYLRNHPDDRILYYKNERNLGVFGNWNRGIELSNSKWVTLLHSDDFYKPNFLINMINIIKDNPNIDQLACKYEMLDYTSGEVNEADAMKPGEGKVVLRKVDYREYMYDMFTSVKGSIYRRDTLIEIGGFRSQDIALGLDDYSLMMRYAYQFNTYYLDTVLYIDSWGFNDSLNLKHWYPQLIADYFMWKNIERKRSPLIRWAYKLKDVKVLVNRAVSYSDGTSYIKKKVPVDFDELYQICGLKSGKYNKFITFIGRVFAKADEKRIKLFHKRIYITLI